MISSFLMTKKASACVSLNESFIDIDLPPIVRLERQGGGNDAVSKAADLLTNKLIRRLP